MRHGLNVYKRDHKYSTSWEAFVSHAGRRYFVGTFGSFPEALEAQARAKADLLMGIPPTPPPHPVKLYQRGKTGVHPRTLKDGTVVFDIRINSNGYRHQIGSFPTPIEAAAERSRLIDELNKGNHAYVPSVPRLPKHKALGAELKMDPPPAPDITFRDYAYAWHKERLGLWATGNLYANRSCVTVYLNPLLGACQVRGISVTHLDQLEAAMEARAIGGWSRSKIRRTLKKILDSAILDQVITSHPATFAWCRTGKLP